MPRTSGQDPYRFAHCEDLRAVPAAALPVEERLHGGFATDPRPGQGELYYGMPGLGVLRISADLTTQEAIGLPDELKNTNFHGAKIGQFDGQTRLFLAAESEARVAIVSLEGEVDFILPAPVFEAYAKKEQVFRPTDIAHDDGHLFVADGYGENYIAAADLSLRDWTGVFGGKTDDPQAPGKFGTAHGLNLLPGAHHHLAVADRPHSRVEIMSQGGEFIRQHGLPEGSRPCGIDFLQRHGSWLGVIGSLDDPEPGRAAPIYVLDEHFEVISTIRPKEDLGIERADHIHNVVWHEHDGNLFLVCQSWNPGYFFVLQHIA